MKTIRRFTLWAIVGVLLMLATGISVIAQEDTGRATGNVIVVTGVNGGSSCTLQIANIYISTTETLYLSVLMMYQGQVVADVIVSANYPGGLFATATTAYNNSRGLAPVNLWPLTPGHKVSWFFTLYTQDFQPVYEARAVLASCDSTTLKSSAHGPAYQLLANHSFEDAGGVLGAPDPETPMFWKRKNALNDSRVCVLPGPRGGSSNYTGDCGFLFIADAGVTTKVKQTYTGTIGQAGDIVLLNGFAQSFIGYSGGGKFKALLAFADGTTQILTRNFPSGESLYGAIPYAYPYNAFLVMPAPLVSATVIIMQKNGTGNVAVDDVTLSVFTNTSTPLRALPLPAAPGAAFSVLDR